MPRGVQDRRRSPLGQVVDELPCDALASFPANRLLRLDDLHAHRLASGALRPLPTGLDLASPVVNNRLHMKSTPSRTKPTRKPARRPRAAPAPAAEPEQVLFRGAAIELVATGDVSPRRRAGVVAVATIADLIARPGLTPQERGDALAALGFLVALGSRQRARRAV